MGSSKAPSRADGETKNRTGKSKKYGKRRKSPVISDKDDNKVLAESKGTESREVYHISAGDEDCSKGMKGKSKKSGKRRKHTVISDKDDKQLAKSEGTNSQEVYHISVEDEDSSKGMKKWITQYHQSKPGLKILQQRIDDFITLHEEKLEQERREREARAAEGGWTVVVHHKGRKKTTDPESGVTVGSVAPAVVERKMAKRKREVGMDFYRFQRKEAKMKEIISLQSKFEQDKKRIQQMRAARKFKPY